VALSDALEQAHMARAQLELERARLAIHEVRAPFHGRILDVEVSKGQSMVRSESILTLADLKTLRVELHVPIAWYGRVEVGRTYELLADEPVGQIVQGILVAAQPVVDAGTRTFRCTFEIDNAHEQWPAGFIVRWSHGQRKDDSTVRKNKSILRSMTFDGTTQGLVAGGGDR
jgi:multidrug efflux pump subunit AcrA (membrane-fusion protein)